MAGRGEGLGVGGGRVLRLSSWEGGTSVKDNKPARQCHISKFGSELGYPRRDDLLHHKKGSRDVRHEEGGKQTEVRLNAEGLKKKKNAGKDLLLGKGTFSFQAINKGTLWGHKGEAK